jgi:hypothetical protein
MKKMIFLLCIVLMLATESFGFYKHLSESQIKEAIAYGVDNKETDDKEFYKPWTFFGFSSPYQNPLGQSFEFCVILTKYLTIADNARKEAQKGKSVTTEFNSHINSDRYLIFILNVVGDEIDFASDLHSYFRLNVLEGNDTNILPVKRKNQELASRSSFWPDSPAYVAFCWHYYRLSDIPEDARFLLTVTKLSGEDVGFGIDLSKIK